MNEFQSSPQECRGSVSSMEGQPPLPKTLSAILNSSGGSWRDIEKVHRKLTPIQADISKSRVSDSLSSGKPTSLDAALALLGKEMVGLRQLDKSLFCQLWYLCESIHEYKGAFQDISSSLMSENTFATDICYSEEEDDEEDNDGENVPRDPPGTPLTLQPTKNSRDQWINESFHIPL